MKSNSHWLTTFEMVVQLSLNLADDFSRRPSDIDAHPALVVLKRLKDCEL